jgi:hypothetical protein
METTCVYLGPWEGGTWGNDEIVVAYQWFDTEEAANAAKEAVMALAQEMTQQALSEHGEYCQRTLEWLDARGLDADFLSEPDGPSQYHVYTTDAFPSNRYASRSYE